MFRLSGTETHTDIAAATDSGQYRVYVIIWTGPLPNPATPWMRPAKKAVTARIKAFMDADVFEKQMIICPLTGRLPTYEPISVLMIQISSRCPG